MIQSDATLFALIESIVELGDAGVTELADRHGLAKSTVHKHLATLEKHEYAVKEDGQYRLSLKFLDMGIRQRNRIQVHQAARPKLHQLADETHEMASVIVEEHGYGVFIDRVLGAHTVNTKSRLGSRMYLHSHSGGKAILAHLPEERVEAIIDRHALPALTSETITSEEELYVELDAVRERGYAMNLQESIEGIHALSAPIMDDDGVVIGAVGVAGAAHRLPIEKCEGGIDNSVLAAANEIELDLIYSQ